MSRSPMPPASRHQQTFGSLILLSRWRQAPRHLGLIVAQGGYVSRAGHRRRHEPAAAAAIT